MANKGDRFSSGYFEREKGSAYLNYSWRPDLVYPRLDMIIQYTGITLSDRILDFGCAKGFYVMGLRNKGFKTEGLDISEYVLSCAPPEVKPFLHHPNEHPLGSFKENEFDLVIAKDVLEHLDYSELVATIEDLKRIGKKLLVTAPICDETKRYLCGVSEKDITHKVRLTAEEWTKLLGKAKDCPGLAAGLYRENSYGVVCVIVTK